jgi:hypothetical protein
LTYDSRPALLKTIFPVTRRRELVEIISCGVRHAAISEEIVEYRSISK